MVNLNILRAAFTGLSIIGAVGTIGTTAFEIGDNVEEFKKLTSKKKENEVPKLENKES